MMVDIYFTSHTRWRRRGRGQLGWVSRGACTLSTNDGAEGPWSQHAAGRLNAASKRWRTPPHAKNSCGSRSGSLKRKPCDAAQSCEAVNREEVGINE